MSKRTILQIFGTASAQFVLAYLTLYIQAIYPVWSSPFWPASGAALAACILGGPWMLLGVYIGLALPNLTLWSATPNWISLVLPIGNVMETALAWLLLKSIHKRFDYRFSRVNQIAWFLVVAPWIPAAISAIFVQTSLLWAGIVPQERFPGELLVFWLGNATGIILVTPLILVWRDISKYNWFSRKGFKVLLLLATVSIALWIFHNDTILSICRMTLIILIPLFVWGIWSTGIRGATLLCLLASFFYFIYDVPNSRPLSLLMNERHLQANIGFAGILKLDSPLNRILPPSPIIDEGLEQIGILTALCLTFLPLGVAADELRRRGEQDDLIMKALDSTFWTWSSKDGLLIFNEKIAREITSQPLLFQAHLPSGLLTVPAKNPQHPGYLSYWAVTEAGSQLEPLVITGILQSRTEVSQRKVAEQTAERATLEIQALRSHLNPHLIFNCLTGLRAMIRSNPELARDFTSRLARFFRAVVDSQVSTLITLAHEIEICSDYISMENIRGRKIRFLHDPRPTDSSIFIPPLSLVTLIENAVKHGQADEHSVLSIELICQIEGKLITLIVRNRGEIRDQGKGTQPGGLTLLRQQLRLTHGSTSSIDIVQSAPHFVEARISFSDPR